MALQGSEMFKIYCGAMSDLPSAVRRIAPFCPARSAGQNCLRGLRSSAVKLNIDKVFPISTDFCGDKEVQRCGRDY